VISPNGVKNVLRVSSEMRLLSPPTKTVVLLGSVEFTPPPPPRLPLPLPLPDIELACGSYRLGWPRLVGESDAEFGNDETAESGDCPYEPYCWSRGEGLMSWVKDRLLL
jgi:hypothetical protein